MFLEGSRYCPRIRHDANRPAGLCPAYHEYALAIDLSNKALVRVFLQLRRKSANILIEFFVRVIDWVEERFGVQKVQKVSHDGDW